VRLKQSWQWSALETAWDHPLTRLSSELEGHPLGGGMLKVEPREASRILLPGPTLRLFAGELKLIEQAVKTMRRWRHYD
jgi:hypothetical protein